ncbi:MAG: magnesium transporter, partial [Bdellovibrionota bacterium]
MNSEEPKTPDAELIANDLAVIHDEWSHLNNEKRIAKFNSLNRTEAEELFLNLNAPDQCALIEDLTNLEIRSWLRLLAPDDAADLIQEFNSNRKEELLSLLDPQTKREVSALLAYAEDAAGGLMNSRFIRLRPNMNVDEAISYIRIQAKTQVETVYYSYVLDTEQKLVGV